MLIPELFRLLQLKQLFFTIHYTLELFSGTLSHFDYNCIYMVGRHSEELQCIGWTMLIKETIDSFNFQKSHSSSLKVLGRVVSKTLLVLNGKKIKISDRSMNLLNKQAKLFLSKLNNYTLFHFILQISQKYLLYFRIIKIR